MPLPAENPQVLTPLKRALLALEDMQSRVAAAERAQHEPVAIIGLGCRFPGDADTPAAFWRLLAEGRDAVGEVPAARWPTEELRNPDPAAADSICTRYGAFLEDIEGFDPAFFGISPREALSMDPQHRLLLEVSWEALAAAGQLHDRLAGSPTGVFVGITTVEFGQLQLAAGGIGALDAYHITGNALNAAAGRLAYVFGLQGPCLAVDTACSSSLVAVHLACESLRAGGCAVALAAGVNLILSPRGSIALSRGRVLSPTGRTRAFDAAADGMVRGEGCGVLVLKRLSEAQRAGDRILAIIRGSGVNQDGASSGLTVPNGPAQEALLRRVLTETRTKPSEVSFIEAHGTGTALGDPIEAGALGAVFGPDRAGNDPLWLGSVKTNLGHLESAAGVASLIKVVLALHHGAVPPNLHFRIPSPHIPWDRLPLRVPTALVPWPRGPRPRLAGVSAFGFSGTNAHVLLEEPPSAAPDDPRGLVAPPSPFRREQFPVPWTPRFGPAIAAKTVHPLLGSVLPLAGSDELRFDGVLGPTAPAMIADHRVFDMTVLPAAALLEMALAAARLFAGGGAGVKGLMIRRPLVFLEGGARRVQTTVAQRPGSRAAIRIFSCPADESEPGGAGGWQLHAEAEVTAGEHAGPTEELAAAESRCPRMTDVARCYSDFSRRGLDYGPAFRTLIAVSGGVDEVVAEVRLPGGVAHDGWILHPVLLDGCFQALGAALGEGAVLLPAGIGAWRVWAPAAPSSLRVHARVRRDAGGFSADFDLFDAAGESIARLDGLALRIASAESIRRAVRPLSGGWLYEVAWTPAGRTESGRSRATGAWLVVKDRTGLAEALAERLEDAGCISVLTPAGDVKEALAARADWFGCVHLGAFCEPDTASACGATLRVAHALVERDRPLMLWIVTRGAAAADGVAADPAAASVWGLGRVLANEHPELACRMVDLDAGADTATALADECLKPDEEEQVVWRAGRRLAARLARLETASGPVFAARADGAYLITGGTGALGLLTAEWLIGRGARHLVLVGRSPPSPAAREKIAAWELAGADVAVCAADVADRAAVEAVVHNASRGRPWRGVVHAAGVLDDGAVLQQTPARYARVLAAKALGAEHLDDLTGEMPLDFFVLFSSAAAVLGTPGQSNYAAANSYLDALAHRRRAAGRPALSVNWGPWAAGMGSSGAGRHGERGVGSIPPERGFEELERLLGAGVAQALVLQVDWPVFARSFGDGSMPRLFLDLAGGARIQVPATPMEAGLGTRLAAAAGPERLSLLEDFVRREVAQVVRVAPERLQLAQPLSSLGLDSLMAIELRNRVRLATGIDLPVVHFLEGASVAALAAELAARIGASVASFGEAEPGRAAQAAALLSAGQEALWFLHAANPASSAYNTAFALRLRGPLDVAALSRAFRVLAERHPLLRATFPSEQGAPSLVVAGRMALEPAIVEAAAWDVPTLVDRVAADYSRPFDLERGPLARVTLFRLGEGEHVLLCTIHHIVGDAWTNWVLLDELRRVYAAACAGRSADLPALAASYADFARWQRDLMGGTEGERLWDYWRGQLAGDLPVLNLPADLPRPAVLVPQGAAVPFELPEPLFERLRALAREQGTTPFTVLLAAWQVLLHRHTGEDDIIVGAPTSGRARPEFDGLVGYFVNPVPLRAHFTCGLRFTELLAQVRQTVLGGLAHADLPLPVLVERLKLPRDTGRSPLFQTMFAYQKPPESASGARAAGEWGGLEVEEFPLVQMAGQFELILEVFEGAGASLKYHTALFTADSAKLFARRFKVLLEGIVANPACPVDDLPILDQAERTLVVSTWNNTPASYPEQFCLHELVARQAERTPDSVAVEFDATTMTYSELDARANRLARWLRLSGVGPDQLVGVCAERSLELVIALLGVLKAGGAYVPLDPAYPRERLEFMRDDSAVGLVLTQTKLANAWTGAGVRVLRLDQDLPEIAGEPADAPQSGVKPDHLAYMIYTSGSTGRPKGALNTHRAIVNRLLWMQDAYQLAVADAVVQKTPLSFDVSVWEFFWPLMTGARLVMARPGGHQDAGYLADLVARTRVTTMHFVPSMLQVFVEEPGLAKCRFLRQVFCSGEALPADLQTRFHARHSAQLHNLYGPTEAAVDVTFWRCLRGDPRPIVPIGRPIARTQMYVLDKRLEPAPPGVPGELFIGGVGVSRGYHRRPELTAEKFIPDPFGTPGLRLYRTGDLARWLPDGTLEYLGRLDHQVKLRGFRIELGEVEAALARQPGVREAVVVLREDLTGDRGLAAYLTADGPAAPDVALLRESLRTTLPEYMVPADLVVLPSLPLSPSGKVDRRALPAPPRERPAQEAPFSTPETDTERRLAAVWCDVLGRERVGTQDNFFDIGGHSLRLALVHARLQGLFPQAPTLVELFQFPTIRSLAARIDGAASLPTAPSEYRGDVRASRRDGLREQSALRRNARNGGGG